MDAQRSRTDAVGRAGRSGKLCQPESVVVTPSDSSDTGRLLPRPTCNDSFRYGDDRHGDPYQCCIQYQYAISVTATAAKTIPSVSCHVTDSPKTRSPSTAATTKYRALIVVTVAVRPAANPA